MELRRRRELEREGVAAQIRRMRLAQEGRRGNAAALFDRRQDRASPGLLELGELQRGRAHWHRNAFRLGLRGWRGLVRRRFGLSRRWWRRCCRRLTLLEPLEAEGNRLAREVAGRPRHLYERELERQARVAALAHVVDRDREQVDGPKQGRLPERVRPGVPPAASLPARCGCLWPGAGKPGERGLEPG